MKFNKKYIENALNDLHFKDLTEIQEKVIPLAMDNQNIIGQSQTGSGKTHSFLIPIFEKLDENLCETQIIILTPTRELALQIYNVANHIASFSEIPIDIKVFVGGTDRDKEIKKLKNSEPHIVIGTPGKIHDLVVKENILHAYKVNTLVIDEADMALETGFLKEIDGIAKTMNSDLQMMVFSATIPVSLKPFLKKYMKNPIHIHINAEDVTNVNIEHIFIPLKNKDKKQELLNITSFLNPYLCLIFANKKETVREVYNYLRSNKVNVCELHGDLPPRERKSIMNRINNLEYVYVVCSDIASRGIDIDGVSHVINYELPKDVEFYVHRVGRTGRASYKGIALSLYDRQDDEYISALEKKKIDITYKKVQDNGLVKTLVHNQRGKRVNRKVDEVREAAKHNVKRNNKKVKPGYKKKYSKQLQLQQTKLRRTKRGK